MEEGNDMAASSGFSDPLTLDSKYYNKYTNNDPSLAFNGNECLSHSLSETSGWYNDYHSMVSETYPWLLRGGSYFNGTGAGVFGFNANTSAIGGSYIIYSFRLVMSPNL